jgi:hypothetical protein
MPRARLIHDIALVVTCCVIVGLTACLSEPPGVGRIVLSALGGHVVSLVLNPYIFPSETGD